MEDEKNSKQNLTPVELSQKLNQQWIRRYGSDSMSGNCGKIAGMLSDKLNEKGFQHHLVSGTYKGFPGNHMWVEHEGQILDPSVHQYGVDLSVAPNKNTVQHSNYIPHTKMLISKYN